MPELIDSPEALADALDRLRGEPALALDTETDAFFAYRPRICLLQFSIPGLDLIVDPLAGLDLSPVGELIADPEREVVLHAAENDVILLQHQYDWRIGRLFDTQVASFVLGLTPYSLAGILEARFKVKLDKRQQRSDWSRRPLTSAQIEYAAEDTHYLLDLAADLHARLAAAGRTEEVETECRRIAQREWTPEPFDTEGFRRLPGAKGLEGVTLRLVRDLYLFRNGEAERRNRAPYRILSDQALIALALGGGAPDTKGVPASFWRRYGRRIERLVAEARRRGPLPVARPRRAREAGERVSKEAKRRFERLRRWRAQAAAERGVETFVVARNDLLMKVAAADCRTRADLAEHLEPFRLHEYGDAMLSALRDSGSNAPRKQDR